MTPDDTPDDVNGQDRLRIVMPARDRRRSLAPRQVLFAGVAGACVLGAGLGLWARPAMSERQAAAIPSAAALTASAPAAAPRLQIVVDDRPAPVGAPIDVLPAGAAPATQALWPAFDATRVVRSPAPMAPTRPPAELLRVRAEAPSPPVPQAPIAAAPREPVLAPLVASAASAFAAAKLVIARAEAHAGASPRLAAIDPPVARATPKHRSVKLVAVKAPPKPPPKAGRIEVAHAAAARPAAAKAAAHRIEVARAERLEGLQLARAAKAERLEQLKLAKAEARGRAEARAEARAEVLAQARDDARKRKRLASLMHALQRALPHQARPHQAAVELARLDRRPAHKSRQEVRREARVEQASLKGRRASRAAGPPAHSRAALPPPQHASGLMKVSTPRCASRGAGAALVCTDPSLGAAERQLTRAYQSARAAGVPDAQLQREQQRWLAARSAAAREAPWAVHDVYLARIAELNGLAREAHGGGY